MNICSVFLVFSRETLKYLERYVKEHKFHFDGDKKEQREISGSFTVKPISNNTVTVEVNKKIFRILDFKLMKLILFQKFAMMWLV
jgi:hypothetical protein